MQWDERPGVFLVPAPYLFEVARRLAVLQAQLAQGLDVRDLNLEHVQLRPHQLQVKVGEDFTIGVQERK